MRKYFSFLPFEFWRGERLTPEFVKDWERFADHLFPPKALNFFVQHKRPVQTTELGAAGDHWKKAYYAIKIDKEQQLRLQILEDRLGNSGVVTYAGAAFLSKSELWEHQELRSIISSSNFVSAKKLTGHSRYTYVEAGHAGFANEEPTVINDEPIIERLSIASEYAEGDLSNQVKFAGKIIDEIMHEDDPERMGLYFTLQKRILRKADYEFEEGGFFIAVLRISLFCMVNSTSWTVISRV